MNEREKQRWYELEHRKVVALERIDFLLQKKVEASEEIQLTIVGLANNLSFLLKKLSEK